MNLRKKIFLNVLVLALITGTRIFFCCAADSYQVVVEDISGDRYFPKVKEALINAKSSIDMVMYFVNFDPKVKKSPVNELVEELINAHKRGVKVRVILDQNIDFTLWNEGGEWQKQDKNEALFEYLKKQGIEAYYDNLYVTTHTKAIVIDKEVVIVGSANWTESSLRKNWEASCLIRSRELAGQFLEDFSRIIIDYEASILDEERAPSVRLKQAFLIDPALAPSMLTARDEIAFDLYLVLLKDFDGNPQHMIEIDYRTLRHSLGIDEKLSYASARDKMKEALRRLEEDYRLITRKKRFFMNTLVTLLNYPDKTPYSPPQEKYCSIPGEYWSYGWHKTLSFPEKYCYMINLCEGGSSRSRLWSNYFIGLSKKYNISGNSLLRGMSGLRKLNIIDMEYSTYSMEEGAIKREPIRFYIIGLYSPQLLNKEKEKLAKSYGKEIFEKAAGYAEMVFKGNDIQVIEDIIKKMGEYGADEVDKAFRIVSEKSAGNPIRSYKYVVGILQKEAKE
jgi:HKD family nuclease